MLNPRCTYCHVAITPANQSREHIIQNAIGGRKEVTGVFCCTCNSTFGDRWDSAAANQLHFLSLKLRVVRNDSEVPARYYRTISGQNVRLHPDGLPPLRTGSDPWLANKGRLLRADRMHGLSVSTRGAPAQGFGDRSQVSSLYCVARCSRFTGTVCL